VTGATDGTRCARLVDPSLGGTGEELSGIVRIAELVSDWIAGLIREQGIFLDCIATLMVTWSSGRDGGESSDEDCNLGETEKCHGGF
jgi:hypothetical protein